MPSALEVVKLQCIIKFMKRDRYMYPITESTFNINIENFKWAWKNHRKKMIAKHASVLEEWHSQENFLIGDTESKKLYLASSFFTSSQYKHGYHILNTKHKIFGYRLTKPWYLDGDTTPIEIKVHDVAVRIACKFLKDLDIPQSTTMSKMKKKGDSFICKRCDGKVAKKMTWIEMVSSSSFSIQRI